MTVPLLLCLIFSALSLKKIIKATDLILILVELLILMGMNSKAFAILDNAMSVKFVVIEPA